MTKHFVCSLLAAWMALGSARAAEYSWDFSQTPIGQTPSNCFSIVGGTGKPGVWKVITDEYPLPMAPATPGGRSTAPKSVVAQTAFDPTDEHFPMLQLGTNNYGDFKFTTHFKIADGIAEQIAGVAFRMQDTQNYYYVRASALGSNFTFFTVFKGQREQPYGNLMSIAKGQWHEMSIECAGRKIHITLDGADALPIITDPTYSTGKIALWTKSDAVSYFADCHITYTPQVPFVETLVADTLKEYKSLAGLEILSVDTATKKSKIIASKDKSEIGKTGESTDYNCITDGHSYYRKAGKMDYVTVPLRDRNGDAVAVARCIMKRQVALQERENALVRAHEIVSWMQDRVSTVDSLY